jgi:hypothetical protein
MDEALIMEIWDTFKEYIPEKNKDMAANQYVDFLLEKEDVTASVLESLIGYDSYLDEAIRHVVEEESGFEDEEDEDDYEEDEEH